MQSEMASSIADVVTAASALGGLITAAIGLRTWRHELRGRVEYDLARRVMILVYKIRDAMEFVQHPGMYSSEWTGRPGRDASKADSDRDDVRYAYMNRLQPVQDARRDLHVELLEVEAIWGDVLKDAAQRLREAHAELAVNVMAYVDTHFDERERRAHGDDAVKRYWEITFNAGEAASKHRSSVNKAVRGFEDVLRPHLSRGPMRIQAVGALLINRCRKMFGLK